MTDFRLYAFSAPERGCLSRSGLDISGASELDRCNRAISCAAAETAALRAIAVEMRAQTPLRNSKHRMCSGFSLRDKKTAIFRKSCLIENARLLEITATDSRSAR